MSSPRYKLEDSLHGCPEFYAGACGGSPPSVLRRDSSSRLGGASPGGVLIGPPPFPRAGRPFHPIPRPRSSASPRRVILIRAWEVSFLRRCPGSPPVPHGTARLPEWGRNFLGSSPWPAPPLAPSKTYYQLSYFRLPLLQGMSSRSGLHTRIRHRLSGCIGLACPARSSPRFSQSSWPSSTPLPSS